MHLVHWRAYVSSQVKNVDVAIREQHLSKFAAFDERPIVAVILSLRST